MKKTPDQAALLKQARKRLGFTNKELSAALGKSLDTLLAWLAPSETKKYRRMPSRYMLLLERIQAEHRAAKRRK